MHASNLQIHHYFLSGFTYSVNPNFDPARDVDIKWSDISVNFEKKPLNEQKKRDWQVDLRVAFSPSATGNSPYTFSAEMVGFFTVSDKVRDDKVEFYIETNATSVLYSTLRYIVCTITAKGPFRPLLLPTVSFYEQNDTIPAEK